MEEVGDDKNYEFLFIGINLFLGVKICIGCCDVDGFDFEGLISFVDGNVEDFIVWFCCMGFGLNEFVVFVLYIYEDC